MIRTFQTHKRRSCRELTDSLWEFHTLEGEQKDKIVKVNVPSCWETYPDTRNYRGKASYKRTFEGSGNIRLEFKGVSHTAEVYVDGEKVAEHYNAYTIFDTVLKDLLPGTHTLEIHVKEKLRSGVFEYMNENVYFDSEGIAQESRGYRFDGVPVVTGVKFNKMVLGEKIPVDGDYFDTILSITEKISTYGLNISEIHFESEDDITLLSGNFEVFLGTSAFLDEKMSKIEIKN